MNIGTWWPRLSEATRLWLVDNAGSPLPAQVWSDVLAAAGGETDPSWYSVPSDDEPSQLTDDAIDWIEAVSNGE